MSATAGPGGSDPGAGAARVRVPAWMVEWWPVAVLPPVLVIDALISKDGHPLTVLNVLSAVVACLPLTLRRRLAWPLLITMIVGGILLVLWQLHPPNTVVLIPLVALYEIALRGDRRRSLWLAAGTIPCVIVSVIPFTAGLTHLAAIIGRNVLLCFVAIAIGDVLRSRAESAQRAVEASEQATLRLVADERLAIAREIHDVVAHGMTAINVQAGVAAHLLDRDPGQAQGALRDIKRTSGEALTELRATLDLLREPGQGAPLAPPGCLRDLHVLAAATEAAGVSVALHTAGLGDLPDPVHHAGYRIVQEALTNVARHSGARRATVSVVRDDEALAIEIVDDGCATRRPDGAPESPGNGMRGMRERAQALGGTCEAAAEDGGGFAVRARLPVAAGPGAGPGR